VRVIKTRRMRWVEYVARMGEGRDVYRVLLGNSEGLDGRIILRWIFRKWDIYVWTGLTWLGIGTGGRHL